MIRKYFSIIFLNLCAIGAFSQSFEMGLAYQQIGYSGQIIKTYNPGTAQSPISYTEKLDGTTGMFGFEIGYYFPVLKMADDNLSLGINPAIRPILWVEGKKDAKNFSGQTVASGSSSANYALQVPVYINLRYGCFAGEEADGVAGIGLAAGLLYETFKYGIPVGDQGSRFAPVAKLELCKEKFMVTVNYVFSDYESKYQSSTGDIPKLKYGSFGVSLLLRFVD